MPTDGTIHRLAADPAREARPVILLNFAAGGGSDGLVPVIRAALLDVGFDAEVRQVKPTQLHHAAREAIARGVRLIVAAGGDGTIRSVASVIIGTDAVLGVLPAGTLNHFAKDLGLPLDIFHAVRVLAAGRVREVDVGEVNARLFLNNSSIGLYPMMVERREKERHRLGLSKWVAMLLAFLALFRRYPRVHVTLEGAGGEPVQCATPLVFVGNNRYETDLLKLGRRTSLDAGELWVYLMHAPTRARLLWVVLRGIIGRMRNAKDFRSFATKSLLIETRKKRLRVATDGEVARIEPPLVYRSRPKALRVIAP
ncbi:MAG TPA: diacylglycerol kinase family protein [Tepidisphaeraceae bacterium]